MLEFKLLAWGFRTPMTSACFFLAVDYSLTRGPAHLVFEALRMMLRSASDYLQDHCAFILQRATWLALAL